MVVIKPGLRPIDGVLVPLWIAGLVWLGVVGKWTTFVVILVLVAAALAFDVFWLSPRLRHQQSKEMSPDRKGEVG